MLWMRYKDVLTQIFVHRTIEELLIGLGEDWKSIFQELFGNLVRSKQEGC